MPLEQVPTRERAELFAGMSIGYFALGAAGVAIGIWHLLRGEDCVEREPGGACIQFSRPLDQEFHGGVVIALGAAFVIGGALIAVYDHSLWEERGRARAQAASVRPWLAVDDRSLALGMVGRW